MALKKKPERESKKKHEVASSASTESTREALINAAKSLFASQGFAGTTVKDIADRAGVNISLVSYHFQGKEGLYRTCLEQYGKTRLSSAERILQNPSSEQEVRIRLDMFFDEIVQWFHDEPELNKIIQRELDSDLPIAEDVFCNTFLRVFETLLNFIKDAQKKKLVRADIESINLTSALFGSMHFIMKSSSIGEKRFGISMRDLSTLKKFKDNTLAVFFEGLFPSSSQSREKQK